ncbi:MAG: hypothetical protein ACO1OB_14460 [Archangium sp.]
MSLPGLKTSIELTSGEQGECLVDRASGTTLQLSGVEAALLRAWDGTAAAGALADLVLMQGVSVEPRQVEQFFARLERSGLLAAAAPTVPFFSASSPGVESEEDPVPLLRNDLVITPSKNSRSTLDVFDPTFDRSFTLYDFEISIARMLDGRRTAGEVIVAANRLGIPATLATLRTFLQQLRAYQFIDTHSPAADASTWAPRKEWTVEVRELYASALRMMRASRFEEARQYVDAMVAADPANEEAGRLRQRIDAEALGSGEMLVPFDDLHTPVSSPVITLADTQPSMPAIQTPISLKTTPYGSKMLATPSLRELPVAGAEAASGFEPVSLDRPRPSPAVEPYKPINLKTTPYGISPALAPGIERGGSAQEQMDAGVPLPLPPAEEEASVPAMWPSAGEPRAPSDPFASFGFHTAPPSAETLAPLPSGLYKKVPDDAVPEFPEKKRSVLVPLLVAVVVLLGVGAVLLRPVTVRAQVPCELKAQVLGVATSPREGVVKRAEVKSGEVVEKGAVLARLEFSLDDAPGAFEARVAAVQKEINALGRPNAAKVKKQKAAVKKAEFAVKTAQKGISRLKGAKLMAAEKKVAAKQAALDKANVTLEALTHETKRAELEKQIAEIRAAAATAVKNRARSEILAPEAGVVMLPTDFPVTVKEGGEFATIVAPALQVVAEVPEQVKSATLKLSSGDRELQLKREGAAVGSVEFSPALMNQKSELTFTSGQKPWVTTLR